MEQCRQVWNGNAGATDEAVDRLGYLRQDAEALVRDRVAAAVGYLICRFAR